MNPLVDHAFRRLSAPLCSLLLLAGCTTLAEPVDCDTDSDCTTGQCQLTVSPEGLPLSQATLHCAQAAGGSGSAGAACTTHSDCGSGLCTLAGGCVSPCLLDTDCNAQALCEEAFVAFQDDALRAQVCLPRTQASAQVTASTTNLRDGVSAGLSTLSLPAASEPSLYVIEHLDDRSFPFSMACRPPLCAQGLQTAEENPVRLYEAGADAAVNSTPISDTPFTFPLTVYVGNSPSPTWSPSGYTLAVEAEVPGDVRITQLSWPAETEPEQADDLRLDLNLFYVGAQGLRVDSSEADSSEPPAAITKALARLAEIYAQAGIQLGSVTQHRVPQSLQLRGNTFDQADEPRAGFAVLRRGFGVWPELPALLSLSAGAPNAGINLFFVADIEGLGGGEVYAMAGGTPGPVAMQGTGASGIAIATDMLLDDPQALGRTLAHEIAHFLGLFHVTESDGSRLDPLADTPHCAPAFDVNGDGTLSGAECADLGADNLMFWANGSGVTLTEEQRSILRRTVRAQR